MAGRVFSPLHLLASQKDVHWLLTLSVLISAGAAVEAAAAEILDGDL